MSTFFKIVSLCLIALQSSDLISNLTWETLFIFVNSRGFNVLSDKLDKQSIKRKSMSHIDSSSKELTYLLSFRFKHLNLKSKIYPCLIMCMHHNFKKTTKKTWTLCSTDCIGYLLRSWNLFFDHFHQKCSRSMFSPPTHRMTSKCQKWMFVLI